MVLFEVNLFLWNTRLRECFLQGLFVGACCDPIVLIEGIRLFLALLRDEIDRNPVSPPQLPGNAPIPKTPNPSVPSLLLFCWDYFYLFCLDCLNHPLRDLTAIDVPLGPDDRLDDVFGSRAQSQPHLVVLLLPEQVQLLEVLLNDPSALESLQALVLASIFVDEAIVGKYVNKGQVVFLSTDIIIRIMGRSDLNSTCPEIPLYKVISNNENPPPLNERMNKLLANPVLIPLILRMNSHSHIPQHCLNTCRSNLKLFCWIILHLVSEMNNYSELYFLVITRNLD